MVEKILDQQRDTIITTIKELALLINPFLQERQNCWVIWDIGYTLTMPALMYEGKLCPISKKNLMEALSDISDTVLFDRMHAASIFFPRILIDKDAPNIINKLREKGLKTFESSEVKFFGILFIDKKEYEEVPLGIIRKNLTELLSKGVL